jgi:hypothetical protein
MTSLFYLHWDEQELKERLKPLKTLGLTIHSHWSTQTTAKWGESLPDIFVISLDKLPSHGRQYAQWLWEAKKRQHIPLVFVDGKLDKVETTKIKFPNAIYCQSDELITTIKSIIKTNRK